MSDIFETMVRQYTPEERAAMAFEPGITPADKAAHMKAARLINTHFIEIDRYQEAMAQYPEKSEHFGRMINATKTYYSGMIGGMILNGDINPADYPEIVVSEPVPYDGTEPQISVTLTQATPQARADLVA